MEWPHYASMMLLELFDISGKYYIRLTYNGRELKLPFCELKILCSFDEFSYYMLKITPSDPAVQCNTNAKWQF